MKKYFLTLVSLLFLFSVNGQERVDNNIHSTRENPWCIDLNLDPGILFQSYRQPNLLMKYNSSINSNIGGLKFSKGNMVGFDAQVGYFFGEERKFGIGAGFLYAAQHGNLTLDKYHVEFKSVDTYTDTFRQMITANNPVVEKISITNLNLPIVLKYRTRFTEKLGFTADAGIVFNLILKNSYSTNALFDYEAIYKYGLNSDGKPISLYDVSPYPYDKNDLLFTKVADASHNISISDLAKHGYNVGLGVVPENKTGDVSYNSFGLGFIFRPSLSYTVNEKYDLNFGLFYLFQSFKNRNSDGYKLTDKVGQYNSLINSESAARADAFGLNLGMRYFLGNQKKIEKDTDHDGVPDKDDLCPEDSGVVVLQGCPDADGDGIPDFSDSCPHQPGPVKFSGCPDTDGDGVPDKDDLCQKVFGLVKYHGCPDSDGDGIPDNEDSCVHQFGLAAFNGCPDSDGDGIPDDVDACPFTAGPADNHGCPYPPKPKPNNRRELVSGEVAKSQIQFEFDSYHIKKSSYRYLDSVKNLVDEHPDMILYIDGYCDHTGGTRINKKVSAERAKEIKEYLVKKGVSPKVLKIRAHGKSDPIATNHTKQGRALNRRATMSLRYNDGKEPVPVNVVSAISVTPNDEKGSFTILLTTNSNEKAMVTITNTSGEKVTEFEIMANKPTEFTLEAPAGLYIFTAATATTKYEAKIVVAK